MFKRDESMDREAINEAKVIARQMINGEMDIYIGCDEIAKLCETHDFPDLLDGIYHLAHLIDGHENAGFNKDKLREDILQEARKLII